MTEIKIKKKKTLWPWIVAALVIFAILFYLFLFDAKEEKDEINILPETGAIRSKAVELSFIKLDINYLECHKLYSV